LHQVLRFVFSTPEAGAVIVRFLKLGMGQGTLSFSKKTQTRMKLLTGGQK
jgi:hypothetical protein